MAKLTAEEAQAMFPGFMVGERDFETHRGVTHRVNSDGSRHSLRKWEFDANTGEFWRVIEELPDGSLALERKPYKERWGAWYKGYAAMRAVKWVFVVACCWVFGTYFLGGAWLILCVASVPVVIVTGFLMLLRPAFRRKSTTIRGPEPLTRKTDHFGASSAEAPADHAAADDLAYRPTA